MHRSRSDESVTLAESPSFTALLDLYGEGADGSAPTPTQWRWLLEEVADTPVTLINFFKLRAKARYDEGDMTSDRAESGGEAMLRYAAVSGPALQHVGGRFLLTGPFEGSLMGVEEDWDMVAIGSYPSRKAVLALFEGEAYAKAYAHRRAAVERQRVVMVRG